MMSEDKSRRTERGLLAGLITGFGTGLLSSVHSVWPVLPFDSLLCLVLFAGVSLLIGTKVARLILPVKVDPMEVAND